jgi:three-Cys-motif partner protein
MTIPEHYKGREQTYCKHRLLEAYLERLFMIVGHHEPTICYVDCFAGPWEEHGHDLEDTSIARSLNIIKKCREGLFKIGKIVRFRALFVEQNARAFLRLQSYLTDQCTDGIETHALKGSFHELRVELLDWCGPGGFAFFFVDPTGWKDVKIPTLTPLLRRPNSEFLINFMYDFVSRTAPQPSFQDDMRGIFGQAPDTDGMSPEERERYLLSLYRANLKRISPTGGGQPRTAYVRVLKPTMDRTHYHLVYVTRHPKGIVEFMKASEGLEIVQKKIRALAKQDARILKTGQRELFPADLGLTAGREEIDLSDVKTYWLERLSDSPKRFGVYELADMLEESGWFPGDLQRALKELINEGKVLNLDAKRARRVNAVNFERGESLKRVLP